MRLCKTPALGGKAYVCNNCGQKHFVYHSCGKGGCCICQYKKSVEWVAKLQTKLFDCPYVHLVTTMPHQLNSLARKYPGIIYNILFHATQQTVHKIAAAPKYLGAKVGLVSVLHTFGSDMKYHVHIHSLLTFGGINDKGEWVYPKDEQKLCPHTVFRDEFRDIVLELLDEKIASKQLMVNSIQAESIEELRTKSWSYRAQKPTANTQTIELYLARYIKRIAITNSRVSYLKATQQVRIVYNDYRNQVEGQPAPKAAKVLQPLTFIDQYLQHILPPYFHKVRYTGLHAHVTHKKIRHKLPKLLRHHGATIKLMMQIITRLLNLPVLQCEKCQHTAFTEVPIPADHSYMHQFFCIPKTRSP